MFLLCVYSSYEGNQADGPQEQPVCYVNVTWTPSAKEPVEWEREAYSAAWGILCNSVWSIESAIGHKGLSFPPQQIWW